MYVFKRFYKSEKHVFLCFYLQINVFNIYEKYNRQTTDRPRY